MTENKQNIYLAVTLGPIYRTLGEARKVRHLWGASFMFSQLMKEIINSIESNDAKPFFERLLPCYDTHVNAPNGVGLFPDRLFLRVKAGREDAATNKLNECLQKAVNTLTNGTRNHILDDYLQTYSVKVSIQQGQNYLSVLNQLLDGLELAQRAGGPALFSLTNYLAQALPGFYRQAFVEKRKQFETVTEISAKELEDSVPDYDVFIEQYRSQIGRKNQDDFFNLLLAHEPLIKPTLRQYHKYIAIVHADGDNIGKTLDGIGHDDALLEQFSKRLFDFAITATQKIGAWGGMPIYAGGDDLLFIAPVVVGGDTIFDLLGVLADVFVEKVVEGADFIQVPKPSLSFGINITYHKFPLAEGLKDSRDELTDKAKKFTGKNCIAFRVQKHSGSDFSAVLPNVSKDQETSWKNVLASAMTKGSERFFSSVMYTLQEFESLLLPIVHKNDRLDYFFENHFNESVHKTKEGKTRLNAVKELIKKLAVTSTSEKETLKSAFALLRFIQFIQAEFQS